MILPLRIFICVLAVSLLCCKAVQAQQVTITSVAPNPVCAGSNINVTYTYALPESGTVFLYLNGPNTTNVLIGQASTSGGNGSVAGTIPANRTTGSYTVFVRRVSTTVGTVDSPNSTAFTVNAQPAAPGVANLAYCLGTTGVPPLTATGQNLKWYTASTGGVGSTTAPTPPTSAAGTTNYYVSQTINGCEGPRATLAVTVNPLPPKPTVTSSLSYCQNATAPSLAAAVSSSSNLKWYTTSTGGSGSTVAPTPPTSTVTTTTYYVSQTDGNGCEGDRAAITVTIKATSTPPTVTTPVTYCQGQPATPLSASPAAGGTLNWFGPSNNSLGTTAPTPPTTAPGTTFYTVSQTVSGCTSTAATITIVINAKPAAPTTSPVGVCQGTTPVSLATGVTSGTNLRWYTTATGGTASTVAPAPSTGNTGSTPYYVSQTDGNGCESDRAVVTYTVNPIPAAPTVSPGPLTYCQNSTAVPLTATPATSATLTYYTVATGGTPYSTLTPSTSASNNYYVSQTLNGCEGPRATIGVIINALPARPAITTPIIYCQFATATPLSATASTNYSLSWYGTSATGGTASTAAPTPPTTTDGAFTYYVSQKDPNGCESERASINVTVNPKPTAPMITPASACLNSVPSPLTQSVTASGTLNWYTASTGGTGSTVAPTLSASAVGTTTYYVSQTNGSGCESDRSAITFTVNPLPTAPVPTPTTLLYCQNATAQPLTATGQNLKWYSAASGGSPLASPVTPSTAQAGPVTYYVSQTDANGCESPRASVTVTTISRPVAPTVSATPVTYCQYATSVSLTATPITGNTLNWYGSNETGGTASSTATVPATNPPGTTRYYVSQTDRNGCESSSRAFIAVTVNLKPTAPTVTANSIAFCQNATPVALATVVTSGTNLKWYTASTGGTGLTVAPTLSTSAVGSTTYYVSQTSADGCESDRSAIVVTVKPLPVAPTVTPNPQNICQSSVPTPLTAIATGTLIWYDAAGQTYTSIIPSTAIIGPTTYSVSQTIDGCEGPKATLTVVVIPKPGVPTVTTPIVYEQFSTAAPLSATASANYSLNWYTTATGGTPSTTAPTPPTTTDGAFTYYVSQKDPNGCESEQASINVTVNPRPIVLATVTTDAPFGISATTANLGGNVTADGGANVFERGIVYVTGNGTPNTANTKLSIDSGTGSFSATVTSLTPATTYSVRAYAINSIGTNYGNVQTFTTLSITAAPVLSTPANGTTITSALPTYAGTAPAGSTVTLYVDNTSIGTTVATGGNFSLAQPSALSPGGHTVYATAQLSGQVSSVNSTIYSFTVQPSIVGGGDLTPTLSLPQANFTASGVESVRNLTMTIAEQVGLPTSGVIVLTLTAPLGYSLNFDPTLTSINVTGGITNPVNVNNASWEVRAGNSQQLTLASKTGVVIGANGVSVIGLSLTRGNASRGSANLTVNVNDDPSKEFDSNPADNIYVRILNSL